MAPNADDDRLLPIAESISEGSGIDWTGVGQQFEHADDTAVLEQLRLIDRIASLHSERSTWGSLSILDAIGRGSFGTVYRAFDPDLRRPVALKVMRPRAGGDFDPDRAVAEAHLVARVRHPNVITVYGAERHGDDVAISMELIAGQTLDEIVRRSGPLSATEAAIVGLEICRALAAVHAAGLLHGGVKAHNVMREEGGRVVLMDVGASRDLPTQPPGGGDVAGTPHPATPEVSGGEARSRALDVYRLGVLLYYLATGVYPVDGDTKSQLDRQPLDDSVRHGLRDVRPDLPDAFIQVVEKAIADNPDARYQSVGMLEAALSNAALAAREVVPEQTSLRLPIAAVTAVALAAGLAGTAYWTSDRPADSPRETAAAPAVAPYSVEAAIYRATEAGSSLRLAPNALISPDDRLYLQLQTSVPAHVYVVNEDAEGQSVLLFPLKGQERMNPLPAGRRHTLPGVHNGIARHWQVTAAGQREHLLIFVSPEPVPEVETMLAALPTPTTDTAAGVPLDRDAVRVLRGVGGLPSAPVHGAPPLSRQFTTPLAASAETARGVWVRQVAFANPGR